MRNKLTLSLAAVATSLTVAPQAVAASDLVSVNVAVRDLDLSRPDDIARLDARIARAASRVCAAHGRFGIIESRAFTTCRAAALAAAQAEAHDRTLAATTRGGSQIQAARR